MTQLELFKENFNMYKDIDKIDVSEILDLNNEKKFPELEKDDLSLEDKKEIKGKIVLKKAELKKLKQSNNALNEKLDIATGKEDLQNEFAGMNAQQKMEFSQHREIYTNPADRRKDLSVFPEYIQRVVSIAENNKLKAKLMKALLASDPSLHAYLIDQMKASTGRTDTFAGLPYLNYSDDKILNVLKASPTIGGGLVGTVVGGPLAGIYGAWKGWRQGGWTEAQFKAFTSGYSSIVSSNLLHFRSSMMNNAQRLSGYIQSGNIDVTEKAKAFYDNKAGEELAELIIQEVGATDVVTAIADAMLSNIGGQTDIMEGIRTKAELAMFQLSKNKFMSKATWLNNVIADALDARGKGYDADTLNLYRESLYDFIDHLSNGTMTEQQAKDISLILEDIIDKQIIQGMLNWGLGGLVEDAEGEQWEDYQAGLVFGWKLSRSIGVFFEGEYTKFWDSEIYNSSVGLNITLR